MVKMHKLLQSTEQEYELLVANLFVTWADIYASDKVMLQQMITNKQIASWFSQEYLKLVKEFKKSVLPYVNLDAKSKRKLYINIVSKVYEIYPKALLKECCVSTKVNYKSYNPN